jgi:hypothetical protein
MKPVSRVEVSSEEHIFLDVHSNKQTDFDAYK